MLRRIIKAPLSLYRDVVHPEWIDYNKHMNEGYYAVAFCGATDHFLDYIGIGADYYRETNCTIYTVETHINYLQELKEAAPIRFTTQLLGFDAKRIHVFHHLYHAEEKFLAATFECMMLHVDQNVVRTAPMPNAILADLEQIYNAHQAILPTPKQAGRRIGLKR